jgi:Zn-finger nucleic acid-binding protein
MRRDAEADQLWRCHRLDHSSHAMPGLWLDGGELEKIQMLVKPK